MQPLGTLIRRVIEEVDSKTAKAGLPIIGKITFGGALSLADEDDRAGYRGRLFWAKSGQLTYSKIRVKQGSFCLVPANIPLVAVSAEYPVFDINTGKADPAFIDLLLRCDYMKVVMDGLSHGGSTKTRIHPEQFAELVVPVPSLTTQKIIIAQWQALQAQAANAVLVADQHEAKGQLDFLEALGLQAPKVQLKRRAFAMQWSAMGRWEAKLVHSKVIVCCLLSAQQFECRPGSSIHAHNDTISH